MNGERSLQACGGESFPMMLIQLSFPETLMFNPVVVGFDDELYSKNLCSNI